MIYSIVIPTILLVISVLYWMHVDGIGFKGIKNRINAKAKSMFNFIILMLIVIPGFIIGMVMFIVASGFNNLVISVFYCLIVLAVVIESGIVIRIWERFKVFICTRNNIYERELPEYSVAVASYINNFRIENEKDIVASILSLCAKKVIDVRQIDNEIVIIKNLQAKVETLTKDEYYLYEYLINHGRKGDLKEWSDIVKQEARERKLIKKCENHIILIFFTILITSVLRFFQCMPEYGEEATTQSIIVGTTMFFSLCLMIPITAYDEMRQIKLKKSYIKYTSKGLKEACKLERLKRYLKHSTLLNTRQVEEVHLWEQYLAYAMVLNINSKYKNTISNELKEALNVDFNMDFEVKLKDYLNI